MTAAQHAASLVEGIARLEQKLEALERDLAAVQAELAGRRAEPGRLLTVQDFARKHGRPYSVGSLRTLLLKREPRRQLEQCGAVVRRGRRVLIDEAEFFAWEKRHARRGGRKRA